MATCCPRKPNILRPATCKNSAFRDLLPTRTRHFARLAPYYLEEQGSARPAVVVAVVVVLDVEHVVDDVDHEDDINVPTTSKVEYLTRSVNQVQSASAKKPNADTRRANDPKLASKKVQWQDHDDTVPLKEPKDGPKHFVQEEEQISE